MMNRLIKDTSNQILLNPELGNPELGEPLFETKGIFSEHYLSRWLKESPFWPKDNEVKELFNYCSDLIEKSSSWIYNLNEPQFRQEFLDKVLTALGFHYIPENLTPATGKGTPDYLLFANAEIKDEAYKQEPKQRYSKAITCLEAKKYNHPLGAVSKTETPGRFPHNQIRDYLQDAFDETTRKPYFKWAILTNGKEWRLYHRDAQTTSYFSFNLIRASRNIDSFKYFYLLFHVKAFIQNENRSCRLDQLRDESFYRQTSLENDLKLRIYNVLELVANGFYRHPANNILPSDLDRLYRACLIFLYRLLFILYAEGRGLLPVKENGAGANKRYREKFSLARLHDRLQNDRYHPDDDVFSRLYQEITDLFDLIDGSDIYLNKYSNVPRYNGGLFDSKKHAELKIWKVGDWTLREVLKGLMYSPKQAKVQDNLEVDFRERIDYSDLEVRQLGSIYEGLLEQQLKISHGRVKLAPDNPQRKTTGSYYTPDFIVKYIVAETIKPQIEEINRSEEVKSAVAQGLEDNSFAKKALKLKILDPAMGSGHFLVRATEYLAEEIACHPTTKVAIEKIPPGESHDLAEIAFWRRRVVESCIYGVDLNDMAVELAKLSLWLTCISSTKPLSYLDHHLRCGNSLLGTKISELNRLRHDDSDPMGLFEVKGLDDALALSVASLEHIKGTSSENVDDVKSKEEEWIEEVYKRLAPYRTLADVHTAYELEIELDEDNYKSIAMDLMNNNMLSLKFRDKIIKINELNDNNKFFHWELEFPDAFHNETKNYDVIIGNPPYVRAESLGEVKNYLEKKYAVYTGSADLYSYFIEKALSLLRLGGKFGMIVSNKWMRARYGENLRALVNQYQIEKLVDFGELKVFAGSSTFPLIITISKQKRTTHPIYVPLKKLDPENLETDIKTFGIPLEDSALASSGFTLITSDAQKIIDKMREAGTPLGEYVKGGIFYGIKTGFNKAFVIDRRKRNELIALDPASAEIIKPFVVGDDVRKYQINFRERYIILTKIGIEIENYPIVYDYLKQFQTQLEKRWDKGNHWWELRACNYYAEFEKSKIVWPDIAMEARFAWDDTSLFIGNTGYIMPSDNLYLLGLLNSTIVWKYLMSICSILGDPNKRGRLRLIHQYIEKIPIPSASPSESKDIEELVKQRLELSHQLSEAIFAKQKNDLMRRIEEVEHEIDQEVKRLYSL